MEWQELYIAALMKIRELRRRIRVLEEITRVSLPIVNEDDDSS